MLLKICQYLQLTDVLNLKKCLPEVENCGIFSNFLIPHQKQMRNHKKMLDDIVRKYNKIMNQKKVLKHNLICDRELDYLIYLSIEARENELYLRYHTKEYKKLIGMMGIYTSSLHKYEINNCFGCGKMCEDLYLHLKFSFPICSTGKYRFIPRNMTEEDHLKYCWCFYI